MFKIYNNLKEFLIKLVTTYYLDGQEKKQIIIKRNKIKSELYDLNNELNLVNEEIIENKIDSDKYLKSLKECDYQQFFSFPLKDIVDYYNKNKKNKHEFVISDGDYNIKIDECEFLKVDIDFNKIYFSLSERQIMLRLDKMKRIDSLINEEHIRMDNLECKKNTLLKKIKDKKTELHNKKQ